MATNRIAEVGPSARPPRRRRKGLSWTIPFLAVALASLLGIGAVEHVRRQRLTVWHDRQAATCFARAAALQADEIAARDSGDPERAIAKARAASHWHEVGRGHIRSAREYRKPLWTAWLPR